MFVEWACLQFMCVLFPASGFSRQMVAILKECNCVFNTFNILADEEVRKAVEGEEQKHEGGGTERGYGGVGEDEEGTSQV